MVSVRGWLPLLVVALILAPLGTPALGSGALPVALHKMAPPDGGWFGRSMAVDGEWLVVGAPYDDERQTDAGAVHLYVRGLTGWTHAQKIPSWAGVAGGLFGREVAISGEWLAVGAPSEPHSGGVGWIYLYRLDGTVWEPHGFLSGPRYGSSIALHGVDLFVGDAASGTYGTGVGAVTRYTLSGDMWQWNGHLVPTDTSGLRGFGFCMDIDGDQAVITAVGNDRAYVFERHAGIWAETGMVDASSGSGTALYGLSCTIDGNFLAIGTSNGRSTDPLGDHWGSVRVYAKGATGWALEQVLRSFQGTDRNRFGTAVDLEGPTLVVGASGESDKRGAVYVFIRGAAGVWAQQATLGSPAAATGDIFGVTVAVQAGDVVVGAAGEDTSVPDGGAVYGFARGALGI